MHIRTVFIKNILIIVLIHAFFSEAIVVYYHLISNLSKFLYVVSVTSITLVEIGILPNATMLLLLSRVLFLLVTMAYYYHLGRKPKKI